MARLHIRRRAAVQLVVLAAISITSALIIALNYVQLPSLLFGADRYTVTVELPTSGGLYPRANVTYLGTEVGHVAGIHLTGAGGVEAVLSLQSSIPIPSDLDAQVHSQTAVGEQYLELSPRNNLSAPMTNGDIIRRDRTSVPPDVNSLLDATNRGLQGIPSDNLKTVVDESYIAFGGLGPEITRLVSGATSVAIDAREHLEDIVNVIDNSAPLLNTQTDTADSVHLWASQLAAISGSLEDHDKDVAGLLRDGPAAFDEVRLLLDRWQPTLPVLLANLASTAPVLLTYQAGIEQLLVLLPMGVQLIQGTTIADAQSDTPYRGAGLNFNMNFNVPPPCQTGYLPPQQMRSADAVDYPDRPEGDLYCRIPQDAPFNVRGARNIPCETRPGKRAPTVKLCESDENYVPLNDGFNWKGDPNATLSGQGVPQLPPGGLADSGPTEIPQYPPDAPPIAIAQYDVATGAYIGPDGKRYTQADLAQGSDHRTWQSMLTPEGVR